VKIKHLNTTWREFLKKKRNRNYTGQLIDSETHVYLLNGKLHRIDGPAIECANGDKYWFLNGLHHREDGPALEWANGHKEWYLNGKRHREDGPAYEGADGYKEWHLNGKKLTEEEWTYTVRLNKLGGFLNENS